MKNQTLEDELKKELKKQRIMFTRLRTPNYRFNGVRYPADFIIWGEQATYLIECKQRRDFPLAPSAIRQLPFMEEWEEAPYRPLAEYMILAEINEHYYLFTTNQAVEGKKSRKSLKPENAVFHSSDIAEITRRLS